MFVHDGHEHSVVFNRLFNYIDGGNSEGMKIPMTAPVSIRCHISSSNKTDLPCILICLVKTFYPRILPGEGPNCESNFTMSFLVPASLQETSPQPTDPLVWLEDRPAIRSVLSPPRRNTMSCLLPLPPSCFQFRLVAREFGGFPQELDWTIQVT